MQIAAMKDVTAAARALRQASASVKQLAQCRQVGVGVGAGVGVGFIMTPLFQTNFCPDLMHLNFLPWEIFVSPLVKHLAPVLTAPNAGAEKEEITRVSAIRKENSFFMEEIFL